MNFQGTTEWKVKRKGGLRIILCTCERWNWIKIYNPSLQLYWNIKCAMNLRHSTQSKTSVNFEINLEVPNIFWHDFWDQNVVVLVFERYQFLEKYKRFFSNHAGGTNCIDICKSMTATCANKAQIPKQNNFSKLLWFEQPMIFSVFTFASNLSGDSKQHLHCSWNTMRGKKWHILMTPLKP